MSAKRSMLDEVFPLMGMKDDIIYSKRGELTIGWELTLPVAYTLSESDYDSLVNSFYSAIKLLPVWCILHKQDVYTYEEYRGGGQESRGFLEECYDRHFEGRRYLVHHCYLYLTQSKKGCCIRENRSSGFFGIKFSSDLPKRNDIFQFANKAEEFISVLKGSGKIGARRLTREEMVGNHESMGQIYSYLTLGGKGNVLSDVKVSPENVIVDDKKMSLFSISEAEYLPQEISSINRVDQLSTDKTDVFLSYGAALGVLLDCEHCVNQYIIIPQQDALKTELDNKRKKDVSMSKSGDNAVCAEEIQTFLDDSATKSLIGVYSHYNIQAWGREEDELKIRGKVSAALASMGVLAVRDIYDTPVLWYSGLPGAATEMGKDNYMIMELCSALCLGNYETFDKDVEGGMFRVCDRMRNVPLRIDTQKVAYEKGWITNYNCFLLGPSGSGKSYFSNYYLQNCYASGESVFIIDIGDSYEVQTQLINEESGGKDGFYFSWDESHPLTFNPFPGFEEWLTEEGNLNQDSFGLNYFTSLIMTMWKPAGGWTIQKSNILSDWIKEFVKEMHRRGVAQPVFNDFYDYVDCDIQERVNCRELLVNSKSECYSTRTCVDPATGETKEEKVLLGYWLGNVRITPEDINVHDFLVALQSYSSSGKYSFLLNDRDPKDLFSNRWTVFELDKLAGHSDKLFYSICVFCIVNSFDCMMRQKGGFKILAIDEAWQAISNETMAPYLKMLWKVARKFSTSAMVITQQLTDITSSEVIKDAILKNSEVKILLDQSGDLNNFEVTMEALGLSLIDKNMIMSVNKDINPKYRYKMAWIGLGGRKSYVVATETSWQQAIAFESDKIKKRPIKELAEKMGSMLAAIKKITNFNKVA